MSQYSTEQSMLLQFADLVQLMNKEKKDQTLLRKNLRFLRQNVGNYSILQFAEIMRDELRLMMIQQEQSINHQRQLIVDRYQHRQENNQFESEDNNPNRDRNGNLEIPAQRQQANIIQPIHPQLHGDMQNEFVDESSLDSSNENDQSHVQEQASEQAIQINQFNPYPHLLVEEENPSANQLEDNIPPQSNQSNSDSVFMKNYLLRNRLPIPTEIEQKAAITYIQNIRTLQTWRNPRDFRVLLNNDPIQQNRRFQGWHRRKEILNLRSERQVLNQRQMRFLANQQRRRNRLPEI